MSSSYAATRRVLEGMGLPGGDLHDLPESAKRFPDGAHYRIEIPSTEGPECLEAVLQEADRLDVPVLRVSQGSGAFMLTSAELTSMASRARERGVEVSMFARPNAGWDASATSRAPAGGPLAVSARGQEQVVHVLEDIRRAAAHGFRSVLIADFGVLKAFAEMRRVGELPAGMQAKISVSLAVANPVTARLLQDLGANTLNLPTDLTLSQIAAIRAAVDLPLDIYIESADGMGGHVRQYEVADVIRVAAPVYVKLGLRNAPDVYPSGGHLLATAVALSRERVRRARLTLEVLEASGLEFTTSSGAPADLAIPAAR